MRPELVVVGDGSGLSERVTASLRRSKKVLRCQTRLRLLQDVWNAVTMHVDLCHSHHGRLSRVMYWCSILYGSTVLHRSSVANLRLLQDSWNAVPIMSTLVTVSMGLCRTPCWRDVLHHWSWCGIHAQVRAV